MYPQMKKIKVMPILKMLGLFCMLVLSQNLSAQSDYALIETALTEEQKALLETERELMRENRNALKNSLTEAQLEILKDKSLSTAEIRKKLYESFSESQRTLVDKQEIRIRRTREEFRRTLTQDQRQLLHDRLQLRIRDAKDRDELRRDRDRPLETDRPHGNDGRPDGI